MNQAMVLCYNMDGDRALAVRALAQAAGIQPFLVPPEAYLQTIGTLCGLEPGSGQAYEGEGFKEEMMLMAFLKKGMLTSFLDSFHHQGLAPVQLKAMLTDNNSKWNSLELHAELMQELACFKKLKRNQNAR